MRRGALLSLPFALPAGLHACAVCFGSASPDMVRGFTWGVILLLLLPPVMILSFVGMIFFHVRRNRRLLPDTPQP